MTLEDKLTLLVDLIKKEIGGLGIEVTKTGKFYTLQPSYFKKGYTFHESLLSHDEALPHEAMYIAYHFKGDSNPDQD